MIRQLIATLVYIDPSHIRIFVMFIEVCKIMIIQLSKIYARSSNVDLPPLTYEISILTGFKSIWYTSRL